MGQFVLEQRGDSSFKMDDDTARIGISFSDGIVDLGNDPSAQMKIGSSLQSIQFDPYVHNWVTDLNGIWFGNELH